MTNILKLNDEELISLKTMLCLNGSTYQETAIELIERFNLKLVLVTLGSKGSFVVSRKGKYYYDAGYKIQLEDTIGSGDAFSAGFMHCYLNGGSLEKSLKFGNATGALVASTTGGTHPVTKEEIIRFMQNEHERDFL